jgi:hypothetical protein
MMEEFEEIEKIKISNLQESVIEENAEGEKIEEEKLLTSQKKKPDYKVLQPDVDVNGKRILKNVGAMWKTETKDGKEYYVMKIGELRLLVFPNK